MAYYKDWDLQPIWATRELLPQTAARAPGVPLVPVLDEDWTDLVYRQSATELQRQSSALSWFVYGRWTQAAFDRIVRLRGP
jgi:hypothetical protein